jgi:hypothetical protein
MLSINLLFYILRDILMLGTYTEVGDLVGSRGMSTVGGKGVLVVQCNRGSSSYTEVEVTS